MPEAIAIDKIRIDGGTQARVELNQFAVKEYAEAMKSGDIFDPVDVYFDGSEYWLADGFHRFHAALRIKAKSIRCEVNKGTQADAQLHAAHANARHGIRRTNADKRRAVGLCLDALAKLGHEWSERNIAKHCGVSHPLVSEVKSERGERERQGSRASRDDKVETVSTPNPSSEPETAISTKSEDAQEPSFEPVKDSDISLPVEETMGESASPQNQQSDSGDNPNSLESVQTDVKRLSKSVRAVADDVRKTLDFKENEAQRPWCSRFSIISTVKSLQKIARDLENDMPVGGTPDKPVTKVEASLTR